MVRISKTDNAEPASEKKAAAVTRKKAKNMDITGWTVISICKAPTIKPGASAKNRPLYILTDLLTMVYPQVKVRIDDRMITILAPPDVPAGDAKKVHEQICSFVAMYNTFSREADIACAEKMLRIAEEHGVMDAIGTDMIRDQLARSYMEEFGYMVWTVE